MKTIVIISILVAILAVALVGEADAANDRQILENKELNVPGVDFVPDEIIVKYKGDKEYKVIKVPQGKVGEKIKEFKNRADVIYAEPNYYAYALMVPDDPYYSYQWNFDSIHMEDAWDSSTGAGTVVAVVDTGIRIGTDSATCFIPGYDFANNDADPIDDNGHGTHVAGTIAQRTNNGLGVAGVAFNSCLMPVKVLNSAGSGSYTSVENGIRYAVDNGADVISLSLGGTFDSQTLKEAVKYAYDNGVTVVAACGNENTGACLYPAAYDNYVVAVGATQYDGTRAPYSNYGPSLDIVAPGGNTEVDQNGDGYVDGVLQQTFTISRWGTITWAYYFFQGTSMATPHVSGVAALVIANGVTGPDNVRAALETTAIDIGSPGQDNTYGWGLVNASAALAYVSGPIDNPPSVSITNPLNGATVSGTIAITADATDDAGEVRVDFYNGSTLIGSDTESPYSVFWDSTTVSDGTHILTATATDTIGQEVSDSISVLVDNINDPPVAIAGADRSAFVGDTLNFDGSGSSDPDGTIASYAWGFGDSATGTGVTASHIYTEAGTYTVTLTVTDNDGSSSTDTATVTVNAAPSEITVFSDSFEISEWNGLWTEDIQNDWFRSTQRKINGRYSAEVDGNASNANLTSIPIDLQGRTNANITFSWYIESGLDRGEYLAFDVSTDGGTTWVEQARLRGDIDGENSWHYKSIDLTGINNLRIQFRGMMNRADEDANVDMVRVVARI